MKKLGNAKGATGAAITGALALVLLQGSSADAGDETASAGPATVCVGTRPVGSLPGPGPEVGPPDDTPLYRVLAYIDQLAKGRYSGVYTGLSVDEDDRAADVYRIPSREFDADICGAAEKGVTVRLHDTDATEVELEALVDRIGEDMHRWDGTFSLREVGADEAGFVFVGVDDPAKAGPILREAYGAFGKKYIKVHHVEQATAL
ncbi:hypothetical protein [Streptomyces sp. NPDC093544]|uniref:hypothetical protein n=1 Tax=Streptomyces sp. NPDC093544 TaxID=3155200 RepID=UPI0034427F95